MIRGNVNARREAVVRLRLRGPGGDETGIDAVVDTGFSASLTLPIATVLALKLLRQTGGQAALADGTIRQFDIYAAQVWWDGQWRSVLVSAIGDEALLGMRLLSDHELRVHVTPGGPVEIRLLD